MHDPAKHPLVVRVTDNDFQCEVLEKLARLEAKMELVGGGQPGRMSLIEARVNTLERSEVRRSVYDRLWTAGQSPLSLTEKGQPNGGETEPASYPDGAGYKYARRNHAQA